MRLAYAAAALIGFSMLAVALRYGLPEPIGADPKACKFTVLPRVSKHNGIIRISWLGRAYLFKH